MLNFALSQAAGGRAVVVADHETNALHNIGAAYQQSKDIYIPGAFVTRRAGEALAAAATPE
jgi:PA domain